MQACFKSSVILCSLLLLSCSASTGLIVTGRTLNSVGEQFIQVAKVMDQAAIKGAITEQQYEKWAEFGAKFQATYPAAVQLWRVAVLANDKELAAKSAEVLTALVTEFAVFANQVGISVVVIQ